MPIKGAQARFNSNMMYVPQFAVEGDNTQLPRQFYRIPASKHYDVWPLGGLQHTCPNGEGLLAMFRKVQEENWFDVRSKPQYLNNGWAPACLPTAADAKCCEKHEPEPGPTTSKGPSVASLPTYAIVLIALAAILLLACIVGLLCMMCMRKDY